MSSMLVRPERSAGAYVRNRTLMSFLTEDRWGLAHSAAASSCTVTAISRSPSSNSTAWNSLNASHHTGSREGGASSIQCSSQRVPGSSMYGSHPASPNRAWPRRVGTSPGARRFGDCGSSMISFAARPQKRIERTMFLPTPDHDRGVVSREDVGIPSSERIGLTEPAVAWVERFVTGERGLGGVGLAASRCSSRFIART